MASINSWASPMKSARNSASSSSTCAAGASRSGAGATGACCAEGCIPAQRADLLGQGAAIDMAAPARAEGVEQLEEGFHVRIKGIECDLVGHDVAGFGVGALLLESARRFSERDASGVGGRGGETAPTVTQCRHVLAFRILAPGARTRVNGLQRIQCFHTEGVEDGLIFLCRAIRCG